jgi:S-DNA-T family DNA segregation ATPase FtsK/SpoIIIE
MTQPFGATFPVGEALISPRQEKGAGVGYVRLETSPDPIRVRAAYVSDDNIRAMVGEVR